MAKVGPGLRCRPGAAPHKVTVQTSSNGQGRGGAEPFTRARHSAEQAHKQAATAKEGPGPGMSPGRGASRGYGSNRRRRQQRAGAAFRGPVCVPDRERAQPKTVAQSLLQEERSLVRLIGAGAVRLRTSPAAQMTSTSE
ncbi:hypothetical protein GCM10009605_48630 [Nocardiopsis composta]